MFSPANTERLEDGGSGLALECADYASNGVLRAEPQQEMQVVGLAVDFVDTDTNRVSGFRNRTNGKPQTITKEYSLAKLGDYHDVVCQRKDTVCLTFKAIVPDSLHGVLDSCLEKSRICVKRMLKNRDECSSKYYKEIPCVVSKSLIAKYQKNKKCKGVRNLVIPICGDKGRQIKVVDGGIIVTALFKKVVIPVTFPKTVVGHVRGVEFSKRRGQWLVTVQYNTPAVQSLRFKNVIGVDRNARGNVAVAACVQTGVVRMLGPDAGGLSYNFRRRRGRLQKKGKFKLCAKLSGKQDRRTKDINHKVSRSIVDLARQTSSAIVLEDLRGVRKGKIRKYVESSQWSYFQLDLMIRYKAALSGIPVFYVNARNTSKGCSRCGTINTPNGKKYRCECGHISHRDVNAGFTIGLRFCVENGIPSVFPVRPIGGPPTRRCCLEDACHQTAT